MSEAASDAAQRRGTRHAARTSMVREAVRLRPPPPLLCVSMPDRERVVRREPLRLLRAKDLRERSLLRVEMKVCSLLSHT